MRILRLLEANGRASYEEIARLVHLSANAVRARVEALKDELRAETNTKIITRTVRASVFTARPADPA